MKLKKSILKKKISFLLKYQKEVSGVLSKYYDKESKTRINKRTINKFANQLQSIPKFFKRKLKNWSFVINIIGGNKEAYILVNPYESVIENVTKEIYVSSSVKIIIPADVF